MSKKTSYDDVLFEKAQRLVNGVFGDQSVSPEETAERLKTLAQMVSGEVETCLAALKADGVDV